MKIESRLFIFAVMEGQELKFWYDQLRVDTISCLDGYITMGRGTLAELKERCRTFLSEITENEREEIDTVTKLVDVLEEQGVIGAKDVKYLKMLAESLKFPELKEAVEEFQTKCLGEPAAPDLLPAIKTSNNAIDPFQSFSVKLALELVTRDVKVLKCLTTNKVPDRVLENIKAEEECSGIKWLECLTKYEVIWEHNVEFLIEALEKANRIDLAKQAKEYNDQISEELRKRPRTRTELVVPKPISNMPLTPSSCLHVFFAAEIGYAAGCTNICKRMLNASKRALNIFFKKREGTFNMELALIKFGNHGNQNADESNVAVFVEDRRNYFKCCEFCGREGGASGIADALAKFVDYVQENNRLQRKIPKICILICFITSKSSNLEYFRCPYGKDAIKLSNTLAEYAIPVYIIGINLAGVQACARATALVTDENHFLSGITLIGGGQYFQVSDVNHVEQAIKCIIKENRSIESNMSTVDDIIILERNKEGGDLNIEHLAELLHEQLNLMNCTVNSIIVNNESLQPISQLVQRVAWADDLDDAINAVKSWKEQNSKDKEDEEVLEEGSKTTETKRQEQSIFLEHINSRQNGSQSTNNSSSITLAEGQRVGIDVARRMVRRQITRQAFYQKSTY